MFEPVIKWSGSKRSQASQILDYFPKQIDTYYEPFCGGASVLRRLLSREDIEVNRYVCSDLNSDLIGLWNEIKNNPIVVYSHYKTLWNELNKDDNKERKKAYFNDIRSRFNETHCPLDFMFIMRTTTNGMPRYNKSGDFNNSFHVTRNGIIPDSLYEIINEWSDLLNKFNVDFIVRDYLELETNCNDFMYLDPPYAATKGMYFGGLDKDKFFKWLESQNCGYLLSYDGISGEVDNTYSVPTHLFDKHIYLRSGNSSFKRTIGKSNDSIVYESLYIKN